MGDNTGISWCDATWNVLRGCSVVSPGCGNCYAMQVAGRFSGPGLPYEGLAQRDRFGKYTWTGTVILVEHLLDQPTRWQRPRRIFVNSMSDLFHEAVSDEWLDRIFAVMECNPRHTFQILTKRPQRQHDWFLQRYGEAGGPAWIWPGASVEDNRRAEQRMTALWLTPTTGCRIISAEPLLASVTLVPWLMPPDSRWWLIVGGESGAHLAKPRNKHRWMDLVWARYLRDQAVQSGTAFWFKQESGVKSGLHPYLDGLVWHQWPDRPLADQPPLPWSPAA